ncbi:hypothetical protein FRX31_019268, partial [Thalictrum thalictroides]
AVCESTPNTNGNPTAKVRNQVGFGVQTGIHLDQATISSLEGQGAAVDANVTMGDKVHGTNSKSWSERAEFDEEGTILDLAHQQCKINTTNDAYDSTCPKIQQEKQQRGAAVLQKQEPKGDSINIIEKNGSQVTNRQQATQEICTDRNIEETQGYHIKGKAIVSSEGAHKGTTHHEDKNEGWEVPQEEAYFPSKWGQFGFT